MPRITIEHNERCQFQIEGENYWDLLNLLMDIRTPIRIVSHGEHSHEIEAQRRAKIVQDAKEDEDDERS